METWPRSSPSLTRGPKTGNQTGNRTWNWTGNRTWVCPLWGRYSSKSYLNSMLIAFQNIWAPDSMYTVQNHGNSCSWILLIICTNQNRKIFTFLYAVSREVHEHTISLRFLGIILRVFRLEVSASNVYIANQFQATFFLGWRGVKSV